MPDHPPIDQDPHPAGPARWIGMRASFNYGEPPRRLVGIVEASRYIGRTQRGAIPDYELTVRGTSGKTVTVSLVESYASL